MKGATRMKDIELDGNREEALLRVALVAPLLEDGLTPLETSERRMRILDLPAVIDDATRTVTHGEFYDNQKLFALDDADISTQRNLLT